MLNQFAIRAILQAISNIFELNIWDISHIMKEEEYADWSRNSLVDTEKNWRRCGRLSGF